MLAINEIRNDFEDYSGIVKHVNLVDVQTTWNHIQEDSIHSCK